MRQHCTVSEQPWRKGTNIHRLNLRNDPSCRKQLGSGEIFNQRFGRNYCDGAFSFLSRSVAFMSFGPSSNAFLKLLTAHSLSPASVQASPKLS